MDFARELGFQIGLLRSARTGSGGIAGLRHESGNDAVKDDAVIEAFLGQFLDARDVKGCQIGPERDLHRAGFELHDNGVFHEQSSSPLSVFRTLRKITKARPSQLAARASL